MSSRSCAVRYISELFVGRERARQGVGRALIAKMRGAFRTLQLRLMMIGAPGENTNARRSLSRRPASGLFRNG